MPEDNFLQELFDDKKLRILRLFLRDSSKEFYLREVSGMTKVSDASTFRIVNLLVRLGLLEVVKIKKLKLYKLSSNKNVKLLESFLKDEIRALDTFIEEIRMMPNISQVILHGEEKADKANILLIGSDIDANQFKPLVTKIKETYGFMISTLALTADQYDQMSSMGLYSGKKKLLYQK